MKTGKSLVELAKTLEDIRENSRDFLVPTAKLTMNNDLTLAFANGDGTKTFAPNGHAHGQVAEYSAVPKLYYDRLMEENPTLLARNVNHGLTVNASALGRNGKPETRMVRTFRNEVRALLSSSYRRLDSHDLCDNVLPLIADERMDVVSSELTDTRLYIKALTPKLKSEIKPGDSVQYGLLISNSDVGAGSCRVEPLIYRLVCKNGLITSTAVKKFHAGRNMAGDDIQELLTDRTKELTDQAFWAQVRDIVIASLKPEMFEQEVQRIRIAAQEKIQNFDIPEVVELAMNSVGVRGEGTKNSIVAYLANGADGAGLTKWGLVNGFTFAAQSDEVGYDRSIELERAGAKILDLHQTQWRRISQAS
jgi:hypothetical protein